MCLIVLLAVSPLSGFTDTESGQQKILTAETPLYLEEHLDAARIVGSKVPEDALKPIEWRFDEPQPDWKPVKPIPEQMESVRPVRVEDALCLPLEVVTDKFEEVKKVIREAVRKGDIPSASIAAAKDGKIIWEESFGWADREKMIPATPHTMYSLASISKPITTTGLMILYEGGLVEIDKPVNEYISPAVLTAYEGDAGDATVRQILNHTSGLPPHYRNFYLDEPENPPPPKTESIRRYGILVHPPGEMYEYANFGFSIVDHIISKVSGREYADFMKREVFLPLGMTHTSINVGPGLEEFAAIRYSRDGKPIPFYISDHPGASAVYSSAHDLIRFGMFHLRNHLPEQHQILKDETIDLMQKDSDPNPENNRYGLGWSIVEDEFGYPVVKHTGSMPGTNTILKMVPLKNIAVVALFNSSTGLRNTITKDIIGELLPDYDEKWKKEKEGLKKEEEEEKPKPEPSKVITELIGEWEGELITYDNKTSVRMEFQQDGDIHIKLGDQFETLLNSVQFRNNILTGNCYGTIPSSDGLLHNHYINLKMVFDENRRLSGYASARSTAERIYGFFSSYIVVDRKCDVFELIEKWIHRTYDFHRSMF
jgi:CubicO group peptidase (beta-lactamase class C family)